MKTLTVTYRNRRYLLTATTSAGMGLLSQHFMFARTDAYTYSAAKESNGVTVERIND